MPYLKKINRVFKEGYHYHGQMYTRGAHGVLEKYHYSMSEQTGGSISKTMDGCQWYLRGNLLSVAEKNPPTDI